MEAQQKQQLAKSLHRARLEAAPIEQLSDSVSNFQRQDAYDIQDLGLKLRQSEGEKFIGLKMGLTSKAKREQMDLDSPLYGVLTDKMAIPNRGHFQLKGQIHPKIEPEVAFMMKSELSGHVTRKQVLEACSGVCACLEILDSRYKQFKYFSMEDVISDNSSSSHFILGPWVELKELERVDLSGLSMHMKVNGELAQSGSSKAISGDPIQSVVQLCELLAQRGETLKPGQFVLAGAATSAVALEPNQKIELWVEALGEVSVDTFNS